MKTFEGYLFTKLSLINSDSEGPAYFLQLRDYIELPVKKKPGLWEKDPTLHRFIARNVKIQGENIEGVIHYDSIMDQDVPGQLMTGLHLDLPGNTLQIMKGLILDTSITEPKKLRMTLSVHWPYIGAWTGKASTTKMYDFELFAPSGKSIWKWSKGMLFRKLKTKVSLPGLVHHEFSVEWSYFDNDVKESGTYKVQAVFVPWEKVVDWPFEVKFLT